MPTEIKSYLNKLHEKIGDDRLINTKVRKHIFRLLNQATEITGLKSSDLLNNLNFETRSLNLTIEALESFLAELRAISWLKSFGFSNITPLKAKKKSPQSDFKANHKNRTCSIEVFCLTQKHGQQRYPSLNVYTNFDPQFDGSKFGRDFIHQANVKKVQLDSTGSDIKVLLCVINSDSMVALNSESDLEAHAEFLWKKLAWGEKYHIGLLAGSIAIYPKLI